MLDHFDLQNENFIEFSLTGTNWKDSRFLELWREEELWDTGWSEETWEGGSLPAGGRSEEASWV